jgi:CRISPR-associated protein Cmr6
MPEIPLQRERVRGFFDAASKPDAIIKPHAGLWLSRGLQQWKVNKTDKGEDFLAHVEKAAGLPAPDIYRAAYQRWEEIVLTSPTVAYVGMTLEGRLFIGMGGPSVIESAITLSHAYGVPLIPASTIKGLTSAYARALKVDNNTCFALFGKEGKTPDECDAGYVIFHDAWWMPDSKPPLAQEIVTVHHSEYYQKSGEAEATDFDSPEPNIQLGARGSFLFAVECSAKIWADYAMGLLIRALSDWGVGGKTTAGYGRFRENPELEQRIAEENSTAIQQNERNTLSANQKLIHDLLQKKVVDEKGRGQQSKLFGETQVLIEKASSWNVADKEKLHKAAVEIFEWLRVQKDNKKRKALLQSLKLTV